MIFYLTIFIAFIWLGVETSWLSVRLPCGALQCPRKPVEAVRGSEPSDELPYDIGYADNEFLPCEDFPQTLDEWMAIRGHKWTLKCRPLDRQLDYPQYKYLAEFERLDRRRNGEEIYQRGTLRLRR